MIAESYFEAAEERRSLHRNQESLHDEFAFGEEALGVLGSTDYHGDNLVHSRESLLAHRKDSRCLQNEHQYPASERNSG